MAGGTGGTHAPDRHPPGILRSGIVNALSEGGDRVRGPGMLEPHIEEITGVHGPRCETMLQALDEELSDIAPWSKPDGGVFVWSLSPRSWILREMFHQAIEKKVAYIPGGVFSVDGRTRNAIRLNFSNVKPEAIREGVARLAGVIRNQLGG